MADKNIPDLTDHSLLNENDSLEIYDSVNRQNKKVKFSNLGTLFSLKKSITSSQILSLDSSPITLINSPGSGKVIEVVSGFIKLNFVSIGYGNPSKFLISCLSKIVEPQLISNFVFLGSVSTEITKLVHQEADYLTYVSNSTLVENESIVISLETPPTLGNSTVDVYLTYRIVDL